MKVSSIGILYLTAMTCVKAMLPAQSQMCKTRGFAGCECAFVGGCNSNGQLHTKTISNSKLDGFAPKNIEQFAYAKGGRANLGWVCEHGTVAILYDCNARIPLYAATVIEGNQAGKKVDRKGASFKSSSDPQLDIAFQQTGNDYKGSSKHVFCYEDQNTGTLLNWDGSQCKKPPKGRVDRGHMVAAGYARTDANRVKNTFVYTNIVPQFATFNRGKWRQGEDFVINKWGNICHQNATSMSRKARIFVIVGAVPYSGHSRFFGAAGFSNFEGMSRVKTGEYRIAVPYIMWTTACCVLEDNTVISVTAFARKNLPTKDQVSYYASPQDMVDKLFPLSSIDLFPAIAKCMTG